MKKLFTLFLIGTLLTGVFAGCAKNQTSPAATTIDAEQMQSSDETIASLKTLGDAFSLENLENEQNATYESTYVYAFAYNGVYYRLFASIPADINESIQQLDITKEDYDTKEKAILSPLAIDKYENLTKQIPTQEALNKLVGTRGDALMNDGWSIIAGNTETLEFIMEKGMFDYTVQFKGQLPDPESFSEEEDMIFLAVTSVTFYGLGDAATQESIRR